MSTAQPPGAGAGPAEALDEFFWTDLLDDVDDGRVLPIVDTGALQVRHGDTTMPYESALAIRLAERLRMPLPPAADGAPPRLDDVVCRFQRANGSRGVLYARALQVAKDLDVALPEALLDLAAVAPFRLFVGLGGDDLLPRAVDAVRHAGAARTAVVAWAPNQAADLPAPRAQLKQPTVFQLMGRLSTAAGESVLCDEDRLEFLHALQDDALRPKLLFDELRDSHLLLLGCRLPDWAARFFLRTAKDSRLSARAGDTFEYLVDPQLAADAGLSAFVADFSRPTRLVPMTPEAFAAELRRRWQQRHPVAEAAAAPAPAAPAATAAGEPPDGAVFVSYSHADADAARALVAALDAAGVDVWFDRQELEAGDPWEQKILRGIQRCALFVPVISADTQRPERRRSFFWSEWNRADALAAAMAPDEVFLLPVVVDATEPYRASVPARFNATQWTPMPGGRPAPAFVDRVCQLQREYRQRTAGR